MPRFVIRSSGHADTRYELGEPVVTIGRQHEADILLPSIAVSRKHARVVREEDGWYVEDVGSQGGTRRNGEPVKRARLEPFDEVQVAQYTLVFLSDLARCRFLDGRYVDYLAPYADVGVALGETIPMAASASRWIREKARRRNQATVVAEDGRSWQPKHRELTFGKHAIVPIAGLLTGRVAATLSWEDRSGGHILRRVGRAHVEVNDKPVHELTLVPGDVFRVGKSVFRYEAGP